MRRFGLLLSFVSILLLASACGDATGRAREEMRGYTRVVVTSEGELGREVRHALLELGFAVSDGVSGEASDGEGALLCSAQGLRLSGGAMVRVRLIDASSGELRYADEGRGADMPEALGSALRGVFRVWHGPEAAMLLAARAETGLEVAAAAEAASDKATSAAPEPAPKRQLPTPKPQRLVGSGFLLDAAGLLVTNNHVIKSRTTVGVRFPTLGREYLARVVMRDKRNDLALLRIDNMDAALTALGAPPYTLAAPAELRPGLETLTIGFPMGLELGPDYKIGSGVLAAATGAMGEPGRMQISNPIQPGNSGGPVFDHSGRLLGVVVGGLDDGWYLDKKGFVPQNVNFAVRISYLRAMLEVMPEPGADLTPAPLESGLGLDELVARLAPYVVMIKNPES